MGNADLVKLTQEVVGSNERLGEILAKVKEQTICLVPETINIGIKPELKMGLSLIAVDPKVDSMGNGRDVFKVDGTYAFHLGKLKEIAQRANVRVISSKVTEVQSDDSGRVTLIKHEIQWERLDLDGFLRQGVTTGTYDYQADKLHRAKQAEKRNKYAFSHAESNAYTRMVSDAIANLPRGMSEADIKKPILVYTVVEDKNELLKDLPKDIQLEIKKAQAAKAFGVMDQIYGTQQQPQQQLPQQSESPMKPTANPATQTVAYEEVPADDGYNLTPQEQNKIIAQEFRDASQKERTEKVLALCRIKNVKNKNNSEITGPQIEKQSVEDQIIFIEKLLNLPDAEEGLPLL